MQHAATWCSTSTAPTTSTVSSISGAPAELGDPRPEPHRLLPQTRGHGRIRRPRGARLGRATAGAPAREDAQARRLHTQGGGVTSALPVGTINAIAQAHIRPHLLQGRLPLPHQGRASPRCRLPEPRRPRTRRRCLRLGGDHG